MKQILIKLASLGLLFSVLSTYAGQNCGCTPSPTEEAQPTEEVSPQSDEVPPPQSDEVPPPQSDEVPPPQSDEVPPPQSDFEEVLPGE